MAVVTPELAAALKPLVRFLAEWLPRIEAVLDAAGAEVVYAAEQIANDA